MQYLCLVYADEARVNGMSQHEIDALIDGWNWMSGSPSGAVSGERSHTMCGLGYSRVPLM